MLGLSGDLDLRGATAVMADTMDVARQGAGSIVYDLRDLQDPATARLLTVFPAAQRRIGTWPRRTIYLAGASPAVSQRLARLRIDRFMTVYGTLDAALDAAHQDERAVYRDVRMESVRSSPAWARRYVDAAIPVASIDVAAAVRIVVSELTTNVVRHVRKPFTLSLAVSPEGLLVAVTDPSRQEPILRPVRAAAVEGRGIQLVDALSESWGVRLVHEKGKTVWARIATSAA